MEIWIEKQSDMYATIQKILSICTYVPLPLFFCSGSHSLTLSFSHSLLLHDFQSLTLTLTLSLCTFFTLKSLTLAFARFLSYSLIDLSLSHIIHELCWRITSFMHSNSSDDIWLFSGIILCAAIKKRFGFFEVFSFTCLRVLEYSILVKFVR